MFYSPLGYTEQIPDTIDNNNDAYSRSQELFQIDVKGPSGLSNTQRAGLHGFVEDYKLGARQKRIADGIMNEFRTKHKELNTRHDDVDWVKRRMIEDARAIWYRDRKLVSPVSQAAELAVQQRAEKRQAEMEKEKEKVLKLHESIVTTRRAERKKGRRAVVPRTEYKRRRMAKRLKLPITSKKLKVGFLPDRKMMKKLGRVEVVEE